jgi:CheY-like chemotaxis protein
MTGLPSPTPAVPASANLGPTGFPVLLIDRGIVSKSDLALAQAHAVRENVELADALVVLGLVSEQESYAALAAAAGTWITAVDLVAPSELAVQLVPERLARRHFIVPLKVDNRMLMYATCQPFSAEAERDLGFASGRRTMLTVATRSAVVIALDRCYPKLRYLDVLAERLTVAAVQHADPTSVNAASSVIEMCNQIIGRAVEVGASHVYMDCGPQSGTIRYRVRDVIESMPALPAAVAHPIRDRFKIMARVGSAIRHRAQDGTFRLTVNGQPTDVRLSTQPNQGGEQVMMQIVDSQSGLVAEATAGTTAGTPAETRVEARPKAPKAPGRPRVLVTDDEPITRMLVKLLLQREHYDVLEATNGELAVEIALRERPDLLLIDLNMPVMDGYQAIQIVRKTLTMAMLPIVVLTAEEGQAIERRVLELGANDYIIKPFDPVILVARVNAVFSRMNMMAA